MKNDDLMAWGVIIACATFAIYTTLLGIEKVVDIVNKLLTRNSKDPYDF